MRIGIPTEIKNNENRVAMTPAGAVHLVQNGHEVFVQKGAGLGSALRMKNTYKLVQNLLKLLKKHGIKIWL